MKPVKGYMTADGIFYDTAEDARLHEAVQAIKGLCDSHKPKPIPPERFLSILNNWSPTIREFLDANDQAKEIRKNNEGAGTIGRDKADDANGDALNEAMEQQSAS